MEFHGPPFSFPGRFSAPSLLYFVPRADIGNPGYEGKTDGYP
jgi:hypothetical protein